MNEYLKVFSTASGCFSVYCPKKNQTNGLETKTVRSQGVQRPQAPALRANFPRQPGELVDVSGPPLPPPPKKKNLANGKNSAQRPWEQSLRVTRSGLDTARVHGTGPWHVPACTAMAPKSGSPKPTPFPPNPPPPSLLPPHPSQFHSPRVPGSSTSLKGGRRSTRSALRTRR